MYGWNEFILLVAWGDYDSAGKWLQGMAEDYGIQLTREEEDGLIELGTGEGATARELNLAFDELTIQKRCN